MLSLRIGLLSIPISLTNFSKSRYSDSQIHNYSSCCKDEVGKKDYCKSCNKEVRKEDILKGISKDEILTESQLKALKTAEEGGILSVLGINDITETTTYDILPYVIKSQVVLPNVSKGFKKIDIKTFYSFKDSLKGLNKFCLVKLNQRSTEHAGILINWKESLVFLELPFSQNSNLSEIERSKEFIENTIKEEKIENLNQFQEQASQFITTFKSKVKEINEISESKKVLLKTFLEDIKKGVITEIKVNNETNPFL